MVDDVTFNVQSSFGTYCTVEVMCANTCIVLIDFIKGYVGPGCAIKADAGSLQVRI